MEFGVIADALGAEISREERGIRIDGLCTDSFKVKKGDLFFCYKGEKFDIHSSASKLFQDLLAEPTTEAKQDDITSDPMGYEHIITIRFRWVEE